MQSRTPWGKVWLTCFVVWFLLAELLQWLQGMRVPEPVFWAGGLLLAIASNVEKRAGAPFKWFERATAHASAARPAAPPLHGPGSARDRDGVD